MLTIRQNFMETIKGGNPDRFVNQYEPFQMVFAPSRGASAKYGEGPIVDAWGVTREWPIGTPGGFPVHTPDKVVIKDIENWKEYVKAPSTDFTDEEWAPMVARANSIDRNEYFVTAFVAPGLFENCHHLGEIQQTLINFYEYPDEMHELIDYLVEYELRLAEQICKHIKPDALFHHDDWGSQISTFISPAMFEEFFVPGYKKIYGYYKEHGVEVIVHHSDSYAATLVPYMIEMGIDVWQGVMTSNNIPELIKKYGGQISFMGGIDSAQIDFEGWTEEVVKAQVKRACDECGKLYFIPGASQGLAMSTFPGVYEATSKYIDEYSKEVF